MLNSSNPNAFNEVLILIQLGDQRMEIYENPSEHYAAVRQLRESDTERERWVDSNKNIKKCFKIF